MSIPIICLAKVEEPHRFEVAKVTADLVCTTCKSPDIDFDEVTAAAKTASIDWKGDTHMGVGFLTGTAPNGDVYEVYSNPNSNPTPCSWVRYGPEGDTGLNSGIDAGRGFTTMQEAMAAAEENAKGVSTTATKTADFTDPEMDEVKDTSSVSQKVTCSSCLTDHVITAVDPAQPMPSCPSCGRDTLSPAGGTLASRKTAGWAIVSPSGTNLWGMVYDTEEGARAHFDEVKGLGSTSLAPSDVASYEVKQVEAEPNRTYDQSLGGNKFQPLGSLVKQADAYQEAVRRGMMMGTSEFINPDAMLPSSVYVVMEPGPNGARPTERKTTDRDEANRWAEELLARTDWSPYTSSLDAVFAAMADDVKKQFDEENPSSTEGCDICGDSGHTTEQHKADPEKYDDATREAKVEAKIHQIADGVMATNPGMNRAAALAVAGKTLAAYPKMIEGN